MSGADPQDSSDNKTGTKEAPSRHDVDVIFSYLVCEEKQDADVYPKLRTFPKKRYGKGEEQGEASSPGGKSTTSTQCSTPRSPSSGWDRTPFTPRSGQSARWNETRDLTLAWSEAEDSTPSKA